MTSSEDSAKADRSLDPTAIKASIKALPVSTVKQIGSAQVLIDPSSVVKELIDNALDARATAVFVEISTNTIDIIQVRDNGHGIAPEDRAMVSRRYCTSKIREFEDLREIGGRSLGFRGEALASMADMSGSLSLVTKVDGEAVAVLLKIARNGEVQCESRASHPVGTTVRVTDFFKTFPVRKQAALKHSSQYLAKIKRLMKAYALSRPTVRFSLHVPKAKSEKANWMYAPKADADIEDAVFKAIGRECASQCCWSVMKTNGFEIRAFIPKPNADGSRIASQGQFISIDSRPVSALRGTSKQIVTIFKEKLRKASHALAKLKDPFMCMNIQCPPDSYDANIEPAKDDVLFANSDIVLKAVEVLFNNCYPENEDQLEQSSQPTEEQQQFTPALSSSNLCQPFPIHEDSGDSPASPPKKRSRTWRANMYGIDEDDLTISANDHLLSDEEDENAQRERRSAVVSNPWTIAKMNTPVKKSAATINSGQLMTPLKEKPTSEMNASSPFVPPNAQRQAAMEPLTPGPTPVHARRSSLDDELEKSIQRLSASRVQRRYSLEAASSQCPIEEDIRLLQACQYGNVSTTSSISASLQQRTQLNAISEAPVRPRRNPRKVAPYVKQPFTSPASDLQDVWFNHLPSPQRSSQVARRKRPIANGGILPHIEPESLSQRIMVLDAAEGLVDRLPSTNNRDIREFITPRRVQAGAELLIPSTRSTSVPSSVRDQADCRVQQMASTQLDTHESTPRSTHFTSINSTAIHKSQVNTFKPTPLIALKNGDRPTRRRRTSTSHLYRTQSSRLPLERVPRPDRIQNVHLTIATSSPAILKSIRKLDGTRNALDWGYPPNVTFGSFDISPTPSRVKQWSERIEAYFTKLGIEKEKNVEIAKTLEVDIASVFEGREGIDGENDDDTMLHEYVPAVSA